MEQAAPAGAIGDGPQGFSKRIAGFPMRSALIVDPIEIRADAFWSCGALIDFGQGYLFGEPRIAKPDPRQRRS